MRSWSLNANENHYQMRMRIITRSLARSLNFFLIFFLKRKIKSYQDVREFTWLCKKTLICKPLILKGLILAKIGSNAF